VGWIDGTEKERGEQMAKRVSQKVKTPAHEEINRHWGDVEVVDAKKDLRVFIKPEDVKAAKVKDPGACIFAQACKRQFAATKVLFWRSVAYVELPGPDGKRRVERFQLSPQMRDLIESFDKGKDVKDFAGFELKATVNSRSFAGQLKKNRARRERQRQALLNGVATNRRNGAQGVGKFSKPAIAVDLEVRDGKGRVQFKTTSGRP
jgi:hypothetical protein